MSSDQFYSHLFMFYGVGIPQGCYLHTFSRTEVINKGVLLNWMNTRCIPDSFGESKFFLEYSHALQIYLSHAFENSNIGKKSCNDDYISGFFVNINFPFFHSISFLPCPNSALNKKAKNSYLTLFNIITFLKTNIYYIVAKLDFF